MSDYSFPEFERAFAALCERLRINSQGPWDVTTWAAVGFLLAQEQPEFKPRKRRGAKPANHKVDCLLAFHAIVRAEISRGDEKAILRDVVRDAEKRGLLVSSDRTTHQKRLARLYEHLAEAMRPVAKRRHANLLVEALKSKSTGRPSGT